MIPWLAIAMLGAGIIVLAMDRERDRRRIEALEARVYGTDED